jgi:hypothetical protein
MMSLRVGSWGRDVQYYDLASARGFHHHTTVLGRRQKGERQNHEKKEWTEGGFGDSREPLAKYDLWQLFGRELPVKNLFDTS